MNDRFKWRMWIEDERRYIYSDEIHDVYYPCQEGENFGKTAWDHRYFTEKGIKEACTGKEIIGGLIYEGDIIRDYFNYDTNEPTNYIVCWDESQRGFLLYETGDDPEFSGGINLYDLEEMAEIIGNIHQNPELRRKNK